MQEYVDEIEKIKQTLSEPLSEDPNILRNQLIGVEALNARLVEIKRIAMHENSAFKGILSDYEGVLKQKLSLGQSLLRHAQVEMTMLSQHT